jgi:hypothetical protein
MQLLTGKDAFHVVIACLRGLHDLYPYRTLDTSSAKVVRVPAIEEVWLWADLLNLSYYFSARTNSNLEPTKALEVQESLRDGRSRTLGTLVRHYYWERLQWTLLDAATETTLTSFPHALFFKSRSMCASISNQTRRAKNTRYCGRMSITTNGTSSGTPLRSYSTWKSIRGRDVVRQKSIVGSWMSQILSMTTDG